MAAPQQWLKVKDIVGEALERECSERRAYLDQACSQDGELRVEVESLLAAHANADALSDHPWVSLGAESAGEHRIIGPYRLVRELGTGGMGQVWLAEQTHPVRRQVALKLVKGGVYDSALVQRFQSERQSLAMMDHPAIAKVFDAGATPSGQPYFVMEYVDGLPITAYCDRQKLTIRQRLRLFLHVCEGVQHAHRKAIIHRDLKPSNILVVEVDGNPMPRIIDFGLAKAMVRGVPGETLCTQVGTFLGTPGYMSPEQADPDIHDVDTRTDVYSLGVVLYELLTGFLPFDSKQWKKQRLDEVLRQLRETDPQRPSAKVHANREIAKARAEERGTETRHLVDALRGDLDWITMRALEKNRERRYGAPSELAADIARFLNGRPVLAGPDTVWYRSQKFVRRHWLGAIATGTVICALGTGAGVATWQARRAEHRFTQVRHLANVFLFDFEQSIHNVPGTTKARKLLVKTALEYLQSLSQDASGDSDLTEELAAAYEKVGDILGGSNLGNVGSTAEAVGSYQHAVALRGLLKNLRSQRDDNGLALIKVLDKLDAVQARTGDLDAAWQSGRTAISLGESLTRTEPHDHSAARALASAYLSLAFIEIRRTNAASAYQHAESALALLEPLAAASPGERDVQVALAQAYWSIGSLFERTEQRDSSSRYFEKALPLYEKLLVDDPADTTIRRHVMITLAGLGRQQMDSQPGLQSDLEAGLGKMQRANAIATLAVNIDPANTEAVSDLVATSTRLGQGFTKLGDYEQANRVLEGSVRAAVDLVSRDPESKENRLNLGQTHVWLATNLAQSKHVAAATAERRIAAGIFAKLAEESPADMKVRDSQVWNWLKIGNLLAERQEWEGARQFYGLGVAVAERLAPRNPSFATTLSELRKSDQKAAEALAEDH